MHVVGARSDQKEKKRDFYIIIILNTDNNG